MTQSTLVTSDLAPEQVVQIATASGDGLRFIRVGPGAAGPPAAVVGIAQVGANTFVGETPTDNILCPGGEDTVVFTLPSPPIAVKERVLESIAFTFVDAATGTHAGWMVRGIFVINVGGVIQTPTGTTSDFQLTPNLPDNIDPALGAVACTIQISADNTTLLGVVHPPPGIDLFANGMEISWGRTQFPGTGPRAVVESLTPSSGPGLGGVANNVTVRGHNFLGAESITIAGVTATIVPGSIAPDGTSLIATPGVYSGFPFVFTGPVLIGNANGIGTDVSGGYTYTSSSVTSFSLSGGNTARCHVWYAKSASETGGNVTAWPDANTSNPAPMVIQGTPQLDATDAAFTPPQPSVVTPGDNVSFLDIDGLNLLATDSLFVWAVLNWTVNTNVTETVFDYSSGAQTFQMGSNFGIGVLFPFLNDNTARGPIGDSSVNRTGQSFYIWGFVQNGVVGAGGVLQISVNNETPIQGVGTGPTITAGGDAIKIGNEGNMRFTEIGLLPFVGSAQPSPSYLAAMHALMQANYGTP